MILWGMTAVVGIFQIIFVAAPWLTAIVDGSPNPLEVGLAYDYSGFGFATGIYSVYGFIFHGEAVPLYWLIIIPVLAAIIAGITGIIFPKYTTGLAIITVLLEMLAAAAVALVYVTDLQFRLGSLSDSGYTFFRVIGWGFFLELGAIIMAIVFTAWLFIVPKPKLDAKK
jgi:hypothetical protein